jgi:hypothetical protein
MNVERSESVRESVTLEELNEALKLSYSPDNLSNPAGWTPEHPAFGHCSAVVQIAHDLYGGEIYGFWFRSIAKQWGDKVRGSHFLNVLPDGTRVDLTRSQFPSDFPYDDVMAPEKGSTIKREIVFDNPGSVGQYARLKIAVTRNLWELYGKKIDCEFLSVPPWEETESARDLL